MKIFQVAVLLHPTEEERKSGKTTELALDVRSVLAMDEKGAVMEAARLLDAETMKKKDRLEVAVRPF